MSSSEKLAAASRSASTSQARPTSSSALTSSSAAVAAAVAAVAAAVAVSCAAAWALRCAAMSSADLASAAAIAAASAAGSANSAGAAFSRSASRAAARGGRRLGGDQPLRGLVARGGRQVGRVPKRLDLVLTRSLVRKGGGGGVVGGAAHRAGLAASQSLREPPRLSLAPRRVGRGGAVAGRRPGGFGRGGGVARGLRGSFGLVRRGAGRREIGGDADERLEAPDLVRRRFAVGRGGLDGLEGGGRLGGGLRAAQPFGLARLRGGATLAGDLARRRDATRGLAHGGRLLGRAELGARGRDELLAPGDRGRGGLGGGQLVEPADRLATALQPLLRLVARLLRLAGVGRRLGGPEREAVAALRQVLRALRLGLAQRLGALRREARGRVAQPLGRVLERQLERRVVAGVEQRPEDLLALLGVGLEQLLEAALRQHDDLAELLGAEAQELLGLWR